MRSTVEVVEADDVLRCSDQEKEAGHKSESEVEEQVSQSQ